MDHDDTPKQMLGRVMRVGQLLAEVAMSDVKSQQFTHAQRSSSRVYVTPSHGAGAHPVYQPREKHSFGK